MVETISKKALTKNKILNAALVMFQKEGFLGAGMRGFMKQAGLTIGGFYTHFKSKEDLFVKVVSEMFLKYRTQTDEKLNGLEGRSWVEQFLELYLGEKHKDAKLSEGALHLIAVDIPRVGTAARRNFEIELKVSLSRIEHHLKIAKHPKPRETAILIMSLLIGGTSLSDAVQTKELSAEILKACRNTVLES
jgi:TetR/AcrR family transcriptional repressor of nem operon